MLLKSGSFLFFWPFVLSFILPASIFCWSCIHVASEHLAWTHFLENGSDHTFISEIRVNQCVISMSAVQIREVHMYSGSLI